MIHFNRVCKQFDDRVIFSDVTLFFPKASYTTVYGLKSSGKTTLLRMVMAYEKPDSGTLAVADIDIGSIPDNRIPYLRRQIGFLESSPVMLEDLTVAENLRVTLQIAGFNRPEIALRINTSLEDSDLGPLRDARANTLNYEHRRLVACVRATIHRPAIILADEAVNDQTTKTNTAVSSMLAEANRHGATVVAVGNKLTAKNQISEAVFIREGNCSTNEFS